MQTALHITGLVKELAREVVGGHLVATEFYKKERAVYLFIRKGRSRVALGFVYHPAGWGCFCVPASKVKIDTREKPWPIFSITDAEITGVEQLGCDRIFRLSFSRENETGWFVFEVIGPNGNIWLLDEKGCRQASLRKRQFAPGEEYPWDVPTERLNPFDLTIDNLARAVSTTKSSSPITFIEKNISGFNKTIAREVVARADLRDCSVRQLTGEEQNRLRTAIRDLTARFQQTDHGYLYKVKDGLEVYPFKLTTVDSQPEKHKTLSLAVITLVGRRQVTSEAKSEEKQVLTAVGRAVKRLSRRIVNIERDIAKAADFELYKRCAELLQINRGDLRKGLTSIKLKDVLSEPPEEIKITLDPSLSPNENIEEYFKKHRKGREGLNTLQRRLEISQGELASLQEIQTALQDDFDSARKQFAPEITALLPREAKKQETRPHLPYREAVLSTGLTIFIGRDGSDNDRTTFEFARPYELWFHAQQCPGSHVVMKFPNKSFEPSRREIEETAAITAYHSKARKDSLVPVVYTERKYVRKPRKAKPGLVTVEREKSIMVVPQKEQ